MSTCTSQSIQKQNLKFLDAQEHPTLLEHVNYYFEHDIAPLYGPQTKAIEKIFQGEDRSCQLLVSNESNEELGLIVYKNQPVSDYSDLGFDQAFEIKTLAVINAQKNSGKSIASKLLHKIAQLAIHKEAQSIFVTVSSAKPESLAFFLRFGFKIVKCCKNLYIEGLDEYFLFHPSPEKLRNHLSLHILTQKHSKMTPLVKADSEEVSFSEMEKLFLDFYFLGHSKEDSLTCVGDYLGYQLDPTLFDRTIKKLVSHSLKWESPLISQKYTLIFINSMYETAQFEDRIGNIIVGINPNGKRQVLGCCPIHSQPDYWINIFSALKNHKGISTDIICASHETNLPQQIQELFPSSRIVQSEALLKWSAHLLSPRSLGKSLSHELSSINSSLENNFILAS